MDDVKSLHIGRTGFVKKVAVHIYSSDGKLLGDVTIGGDKARAVNPDYVAGSLARLIATGKK